MVNQLRTTAAPSSTTTRTKNHPKGSKRHACGIWATLLKYVVVSLTPLGQLASPLYIRGVVLFSTKGGFYWLRMEHQQDRDTMKTHPGSA